MTRAIAIAVLTLMIAPTSRAGTGSFSDEDVTKAIEAAKRHLWSRYDEKEGHWPEGTTPGRRGSVIIANYGYGGRTALAVYALLSAGESHELPRMRRALAEYQISGVATTVGFHRFVMDNEKYHFQITELGGQTPKNDRIRRLIPIFEQGRFYLPTQLYFVSHDGKSHDLVHEFIQEEYLSFPVAWHDDMLDCMARIVDPQMAVRFPGKALKLRMEGVGRRGEHAWMGA